MSSIALPPEPYVYWTEPRSKTNLPAESLATSTDPAARQGFDTTGLKACKYVLYVGTRAERAAREVSVRNGVNRETNPSAVAQKLLKGTTVFPFPTTRATAKPFPSLIPSAMVDELKSTLILSECGIKVYWTKRYEQLYRSFSKKEWEVLLSLYTVEWYSVQEWCRRQTPESPSSSISTRWAEEEYKASLQRKEASYQAYYLLHDVKLRLLPPPILRLNLLDGSSPPSYSEVFANSTHLFLQPRSVTTQFSIPLDPQAHINCRWILRRAGRDEQPRDAVPFLPAEHLSMLNSGEIVFLCPPSTTSPFPPSSSLLPPVLLSKLLLAEKHGLRIRWSDNLDALFHARGEEEWAELNMDQWLDLLAFLEWRRRFCGLVDWGFENEARLAQQRFRTRREEGLVLFELYHARRPASKKTHFSSQDEDDEFDLEEDDLPPGKSSFFSRFVPGPSLIQTTPTLPTVPPCTISA